MTSFPNSVYYWSTFATIMEETESMKNEINMLYCEGLCEMICLEFLHPFPFWSGMMLYPQWYAKGRSNQERSLMTRYSNAPVENWLKTVKCEMGLKNLNDQDALCHYVETQFAQGWRNLNSMLLKKEEQRHRIRFIVARRKMGETRSRKKITKTATRQRRGGKQLILPEVPR